MRFMQQNIFTAQQLCEATIKSIEKNKFLNAYVSHADQDQMRKEAEAAYWRLQMSKLFNLIKPHEICLDK